jgi:hypothetical protein
MNAKIVIDCMARYQRGDLLIKENPLDINIECRKNSGRYVNMKRINGDDSVATLCKALQQYIALERGIDACNASIDAAAGVQFLGGS